MSCNKNDQVIGDILKYNFFSKWTGLVKILNYSTFVKKKKKKKKKKFLIKKK